jgi:hypothetical protein
VDKKIIIQLALKAVELIAKYVPTWIKNIKKKKEEKKENA